MRIMFLCILVTCLSATSIDERDDYSSFSITSQQGVHTDASLNGSSNTAEAYWLYTTVPAFSIGDKSLYVAVEAELYHRELTFQGIDNGKSLFQRYGIFAGYPILKNGKQSGNLFAGLGVASDFTILSKRDLYWQLIYDHRVTISDRLTVGLGLLYSYTHGGPKKTTAINLLPTLRWRVHDRIKLSVNWDNLECKVYVHPKVALVGEGRYDMSWFDMEDYSYQSETVTAGGGVDIKVASSIYARVRLLKNLYQREILWSDDTEWILTPDEVGGYAMRLLFTYVK